MFLVCLEVFRTVLIFKCVLGFINVLKRGFKGRSPSQDVLGDNDLNGNELVALVGGGPSVKMGKSIGEVGSR